MGEGKGEGWYFPRPGETQQMNVQDGSACLPQAISPSLGQFHGYVLPCLYPSSPQEVPKIHSGAQLLPMQCSVLRNLHSTKSIRKMPSSSDSAFMEAWNAHLPRPGRLADQKQVPVGDCNSLRIYPVPVLSTRTP